MQLFVLGGRIPVILDACIVLIALISDFLSSDLLLLQHLLIVNDRLCFKHGVLGI